MTKVFCDVCEEELTPYNDGRVLKPILYKGRRMIHLHIRVDRDVCKPCILNALQALRGAAVSRA